MGVTVDTTKLNAGQLVQRILRVIDSSSEARTAAKLAEAIAAGILDLPPNYWVEPSATSMGMQMRSVGDLEVPTACSFRALHCGVCPHLHLVGKDAAGNPRFEIVLSADQLRYLVELHETYNAPKGQGQ